MDANKGMPGKKEGFLHKAGDKIERLGEKLREKGAKKIGDALYRSGNKIEHAKDEK
jgi:hypothetical protein